jgi:hypothetical protein
MKNYSGDIFLKHAGKQKSKQIVGIPLVYIRKLNNRKSSGFRCVFIEIIT